MAEVTRYLTQADVARLARVRDVSALEARGRGVLKPDAYAGPGTSRPLYKADNPTVAAYAARPRNRKEK